MSKDKLAHFPNSNLPMGTEHNVSTSQYRNSTLNFSLHLLQNATFSLQPNKLVLLDCYAAETPKFRNYLRAIST